MSTLERDVSLGIVHVVDIILLLVTVEALPIVLILEDFRENALGVLRLAVLVHLSIVLNVHASSVYGVELVLDLARRPWGSLSSCCSWIATSTLGN